MRLSLLQLLTTLCLRHPILSYERTMKLNWLSPSYKKCDARAREKKPSSNRYHCHKCMSCSIEEMHQASSRKFMPEKKKNRERNAPFRKATQAAEPRREMQRCQQNKAKGQTLHPLTPFPCKFESLKMQDLTRDKQGKQQTNKSERSGCGNSAAATRVCFSV
jgi:hypothetical protein